jgi:hypothetical protein
MQWCSRSILAIDLTRASTAFALADFLARVDGGSASARESGPARRPHGLTVSLRSRRTGGTVARGIPACA